MIEELIISFFYIGLFFRFAVVVALDVFNLRSLLLNRKKIPSFFSGKIDLLDYRRSIRYTARKTHFSLVLSAYTLIVMTLFIALKGGPALDHLIGIVPLHPYLKSVAYLLVLSLGYSVLFLPFSLYRRFVIEEEFGFNSMGLRLYFSDMFKSTLVSLLLGLPLIIGLFVFMERAGKFWWLYGYAFYALFQLLLIWVYPVLIAPLFNKFSPLPDGSLKERLEKLLAITGFKARGLFVMDASRRSAHGNAYFTGFGKNKRIVLYDTIISSMTEEELEGVLCHEIGHFKLKHILTGMTLSLLSSFFFFYLLSLLLSWLPFYRAFGFDTPSYHALFLILFLLEPLTSIFMSPLFNKRSRTNEFAADRYTVKILGTPQGLINALIRMNKDNLGNLVPHPLYAAYHYTHPSPAERLATLEKNYQ